MKSPMQLHDRIIDLNGAVSVKFHAGSCSSGWFKWKRVWPVWSIHVEYGTYGYAFNPIDYREYQIDYHRLRAAFGMA